MKIVNQYELGKKLYHDWKHQEHEYQSYEIIQNLGKENIRLESLERGFVEERCLNLQKDHDVDDVEAFYGALDEIGLQYWA